VVCSSHSTKKITQQRKGDGGYQSQVAKLPIPTISEPGCGLNERAEEVSVKDQTVSKGHFTRCLTLATERMEGCTGMPNDDDRGDRIRMIVSPNPCQLASGM
jgi:hypothetical protein